MPSRHRRPAALARALLLVGVLVLAGCRIDVTNRIDVAADGSGTMVLAVEVDATTAQRLTALGLSLRPAAVAGWQVDEAVGDDVHRVVASTTFASPDELATRVEELGLGLDQEDPAVLADVVLVLDDDGAATFDALAGVRLPSSAGADATGWPSAADLQAAAGDVGATLTVTLPGDVASSNATTVEGRTATWDLPIGEMVAVTAVGEAPRTWQRAWVRWALLGLAALLVVALLASLRRGRRRRVEAPLGRVDRLRRGG